MAANRIVLTGASKGIGRATALKLTRGGAKVLAIARDEEALASLAFEAKSLSGRIYPHRCDITVSDELEMLPAAAEKRLNRVDALVNNAGMGIFQELTDITVENFDNTLAVCLKAPLLLIRAFVLLLEKNGGDVVNISSICAVNGFLGAAVYSAAKAGLEGMSRALVEELRPRGIRLTILRPGATATDMWKNIPGEFDLGKMLPPEVVAESVEFLLAQPKGAWTETLALYPPDGKV